MSRSERMSPVDTWWLRMDRPHNLMTIVTVWILEGPVALDRSKISSSRGTSPIGAIARRSSCRADLWRDNPHLDRTHHIERVRLPGRGGKEALERFVGDLASRPFNFNHPLWTIHIIENYDGGAAVVLRWHRGRPTALRWSASPWRWSTPA